MGRDSRLNFQRKGFRPSALDPTAVARDVLDRFGRPIELGDAVLHNLAIPLHAKVIEMVPELSPGAPVGLVRMTIAASITFHVQKGLVVRDLVLTHEVDPAMKEKLDEARREGGLAGAMAEADQQTQPGVASDNGAQGDDPPPAGEEGDGGDGTTH
jgi:hypothetical protein